MHYFSNIQSNLSLRTPLNQGNLYNYYGQFNSSTDHFTAVRSATRPPDGSEAGADPAPTQTSLPLLCKTSCSDAN